MKFLQGEHDLFKAEIENADLCYQEFTFSKKKGWLNITHPKASVPFLFHRKSETKLTMNGQWLKENNYFIRANLEESQFKSMPSVFGKFREWLKQIQE